LSQISFDLQRRLIKHFDLEVTKDNAKDRVIELSNGSTVRMGSINQVDSCVGRSYDLIIFDEAALVDGRDAFNIALRPTLDKENSKALFISTPRGRNNWFADFYYRGFTDQFPEWCSVKATYHENPRFSEEDILEARNSMSKAEFDQEYLADFNTYAGQIWKFNFEECIADLEELDISKMDIIAGLDVGYKDPTALCVVAYDWDLQKFYVLAEYLDAERTTEQHAVQIRELQDKYDIDWIYIDSAAQQTRFDFAQNYDVTTINAKKSLLDGIGQVASLVDNDNLIVDQRCRHTIECLDQYQWDANPNLMKERPKHDAYSHMADALRYALYSFETSSTTF
jgi:phage terminase large subunit